MGGTGAWFKSSIGIVVGLVAICTAIAGVITWHFKVFATTEEVAIVEKHAEQNVAQLSQKTIEGFDTVTKTLRRFDLKDSHKQLMEQKYRILKLLESDPDNQELKIDLDECRSRISMIEDELRELRLSK